MGEWEQFKQRPFPAFECLLQQRFHWEILVSECAGNCKHSVLFGFAKEAQFTFNCLCIFPTDAVYFLVSGCLCWECRKLGMWQAGCPRPEQDLPSLPSPAFSCLLPTPCTWLVPRTRLFNAWLLIALEIITFKLLVGDF